MKSSQYFYSLNFKLTSSKHVTNIQQDHGRNVRKSEKNVLKFFDDLAFHSLLAIYIYVSNYQNGAKTRLVICIFSN